MHKIDNEKTLLTFYDEEFIDNVYLYTLKREADDIGKVYFLSKLRDGSLSKKEILDALQKSEEGKHIYKPSITDKLLRKVHKIPFLSYIAQSLSILFTLPTLIKKLDQDHIYLTKNIQQNKIYLAKNIQQNKNDIKDIFSLLTAKASHAELLTLRDTLNTLILSQDKALANKKVLLCCNAYPPHFIGGAELIAHYQALELQKQGYTVKVFAGDLPLEEEHYSMTKDTYEGIEVFRVKLEDNDFAGNTINFRHTQVEKHFQHILDTFQPSIVHMHNIIGLSVALGSIAKQSAIKTIITLHDGWGFCYKNTMMRDNGQFCHDFSECRTCIPFIHKKDFGDIPILMRQDYFSLALKDIDIFISPSHYLKKQYIHAGFNANKINVLSNGIDIDKFNLTHIEDKKIRFTFIGYLGEHKGIRLLLQALTTLKNKDNIHLSIIGEGVLKDELKNYIEEQHLTPYVTLVGKLSNHEIPRVFSKTDIYILPSQWPENQPVTITEAFASKVPVIGTDFGGIKELVSHEKTGLLFPMGDAEGLAVQMKYFIDNPHKIKEFGQNAFKFIKEKSFNTQVKKLMSHYESPIPFREKEKTFIVACVGSHLSEGSVAIMHKVKQEHQEIHFVLHEWLINPYECNLVWVTDQKLSISMLDKYYYLQKPCLINVKDEIIQNYTSQHNHTLTYTESIEAINHVVTLSRQTY